MTELLSLPTVAAALGVHRDTVHTWARAGKLGPVIVPRGRAAFVLREEVERRFGPLTEERIVRAVGKHRAEAVA